MMRWNSTKTYTEEDIMRMQQEAVLRVHEFQSRAKALPFYDVPESAITPYQEPEPEETPYEAPAAVELLENEPEPKPESMLLESESPLIEDSQPEASGTPDMESQTAGSRPEQPPQQNPHFQRQEPIMASHPQPPTDPITGILSKLNLDGETLLILGLMFLLYNEKADHVLLIALAYLLL